MKKILTHLIGIVFLITILIAGACSPEGNNGKLQVGLEEVSIYLKAHEIDGKMHLKMYDSNDPTIVVVDTLHTYVRDSTLVIWRLADQSGIKKILKISPKNGRGNIIIRDARGFLTSQKKKLKIPDKQTPDDEEEYLIKFKDSDGNPHTIDPYLRIPRQSGGGDD